MTRALRTLLRSMSNSRWSSITRLFDISNATVA
jgi:hypothetical protein